jgi:hypothetical protein
VAIAAHHLGTEGRGAVCVDRSALGEFQDHQHALPLHGDSPLPGETGGSARTALQKGGVQRRKLGTQPCAACGDRTRSPRRDTERQHGGDDPRHLGID